MDPVADMGSPGKVKRPHNAFNLFFMEQIPQFRVDFPGLTGNELSRELGRRWKAMTPEERKPYIVQARELLTQFHIDYPDYHYAHRDSRKRGQGRWRLPNLPGLVPDDGPPGPADFSEFLSIFASQLVAHFVLQNRDIADTIVASIGAATLPQLLGSIRDVPLGEMVAL
jgi:hypothetical protein